MNEEEARKHYIHLKTLREHVHKLQTSIQELDEQTRTIQEMKEAITQAETLPEGSEILAPISNGVFIQATSKPVNKLLLNVGANTVIEQTPTEAKNLLEEQLRELDTYRKKLYTQQQELAQQAQAIEQQVAEELDV
ncbi:MAG: prefoldin subunit alpha [Candidatus Woesearchaeota archaeon]